MLPGGVGVRVRGVYTVQAQVVVWVLRRDKMMLWKAGRPKAGNLLRYRLSMGDELWAQQVQPGTMKVTLVASAL